MSRTKINCYHPDEPFKWSSAGEALPEIGFLTGKGFVEFKAKKGRRKRVPINSIVRHED